MRNDHDPVAAEEAGDPPGVVAFCVSEARAVMLLNRLTEVVAEIPQR